MPSRHHNLLDVKKAAKRAKIDGPRTARFHRDNPCAASRCADAHRNRNVICHIFDKSVAFRIGRRSIKSIPGWPKGYKSAIGVRAHSLFGKAPVWSRKATRATEIEAAARYFLMKSPERVRTVSDPSDRAESEEVDRFREELAALLTGRKHINVLIGKTKRRVNGISTVPGTRKADIALTYNGEPQFYLSHKMGSKPGDFRQYGGFVNDMGLRTDNDFYSLEPDSDARDFWRGVNEALDKLGLKRDSKTGMHDFNKLKPGAVFAAEFGDVSDELCMRSCFGVNHNEGVGGPDAVDAICDGRLGLLRLPYSSHCFALTASYHMAVHPRISGRKPKLDGVYWPTMLVMRNPSKKLVQAGFLNCRASVWPSNRWAQAGIDNLSAVLAAGPAEIKHLKKRFVA